MSRRANLSRPEYKDGRVLALVLVLALGLAALWFRGTANVSASSNPQLVGATNIPLGFLPSSAVLVDVNGDGKLDLVTLSGTSIEVFLGNGDGTFSETPKVTSTDAISSGPIALADVNGDGHPDVIVDDPEGGALHVLFGNGDGTFETPGTTYADFSAFYGNASPIYIADMNGDGLPDIVVPSISGKTVTILLNTAGNEGVFRTPQTTTVASSTQELLQLAIGNLMGSGKNDLAVGVTSVGSPVVNSIVVVPNTTVPGANTVTFGAAQTIQLTLPANTTANMMSGLVAANFGNGNVDLVAAEPNSASPTAGTLYFIEGNGNGTFNQPQALAGEPIPSNGALISTDFNNDGKADLAFRNGNDGFTVLLSQGVSGGSLSFTSGGASYVAGAFVGSPSAGDVNGDGYSDIVVPVSDGVSLFLNNQNGTFQGSRGYALAGASPQGVITVQNFFGGNEPDVAFITPSNKVVTILGTLNPPSGTLPLQFQGTANPSAPTAIAGGCLKTAGACTAFVAAAIPAAAANGNAILQILQNGVPASTVQLPDGIGVTAMAVGDFNGDGNTDLALVLNDNFDSVEVLTGNGSGGFANAQTFPVGQNPVAIAAADFNGDGLTDLAVVNQSDNPPDVGILINDTAAGGTVSFHSMVPNAASTSYSGTTPFPTTLTVGDFDGANGPDIALLLPDSQEINVFLNNGNGTFTAKPPQIVYGATGAIAAGEFNGNGKFDLVVTNGFSVSGNSCAIQDAADVLVSKGDGTFQQGSACGAQSTGFLYPAGNGPNSIAVADFDGDGKPDVAVSDGTGNMITLILSENLGASAGPSFASYTGTPPLGASGANPAVNLGANVGSSAPQQVFVTNTGGSPFTVTGMTLNPAGPPWLVNSAVCNGMPETLSSFTSVGLGPGESCEVTLEFEPSEPGAAQNATLTLDDNASGSNAPTAAGSQAILLSGTATAPYASFSPTSGGFPTLQANTYGTGTVTVTNTGNGPLTFNSITITGSSVFTISGNSCGGVINPGKSCPVGYQYLPTTTGPVTATLNFVDNAGPQESNIQSTSVPGFWQQQVPLSGTAVGCYGTANTVEINGLATGGIEPNPRVPGSYAQTIYFNSTAAGSMPQYLYFIFEGLNANGAVLAPPSVPDGFIGNSAGRVTGCGDSPQSEYILVDTYVTCPMCVSGPAHAAYITVYFTVPKNPTTGQPQVPHYSLRIANAD